MVSPSPLSHCICMFFLLFFLFLSLSLSLSYCLRRIGFISLLRIAISPDRWCDPGRRIVFDLGGLVGAPLPPCHPLLLIPFLPPPPTLLFAVGAAAFAPRVALPFYWGELRVSDG